jgi:hypothetical protein
MINCDHLPQIPLPRMAIDNHLVVCYRATSLTYENFGNFAN